MDEQLEPTEIYNIMMQRDAFSHWLGLQLDDISVGYCKMHFTIHEQMLNGFGTVHGGIFFSAADSAFAFACNSRGMLTVALDTNIVYMRHGKLHDVFYIEVKELYRGNKTGVYEARITNTANELCALFKGTAYQTSKSIATLK